MFKQTIPHIEQDLYAVGDSVLVKSSFNNEPDDIGIVAKVDTTYGHPYYFVDYTSGMRCSCANKHIRGRLTRAEKVINPVLELVRSV